MEVLAVSRNVRMSAQKVREVTRQIQGRKALEAQAALTAAPGKSVSLVAKTLKSALANAENNHGLKPEAVWIKEAVAGAGPTLRRFTPKARGSAGPILKRSCTIRIVLTDQNSYGTKD